MSKRVERLADGPARQAARAAIPRLLRFLGILVSAADEVNLLSRSALEPSELVDRHLGDALEGLALIPEAGSRLRPLLDVGSGGGFPAIPLLLCRQDLVGTLVESIGKKARFLEETGRQLGLTLDVLNARFPASIPSMKNRFHVFTTRAVADAGDLVRLARPALGPGGRALLWTTDGLAEEAARHAEGFHSSGFHRAPGAERRGILVLERST